VATVTSSCVSVMGTDDPPAPGTENSPAPGNQRLAQFFEAHSVAVVGASERPGNLGGAVIRTLQEGGWAGKIAAVNPNAADPVFGVVTVPTPAELSAPADVAILAVPKPLVLGAVGRLAESGIRRIAILTSGFGETAEGKADEESLLTLARNHGVSILGPNCEGYADFSRSFVASFAPNLSTAFAGPVSLVSQSGGLCAMMTRHLASRGIGIDKLISTGNECDLLLIDAIEAAAASESTAVVAVYAEQFRNPLASLERLEHVASTKPVVVLKTGRTDAGSRAALSHTGAIAGPEKVLNAMLEQAGVLVVRSSMELVDATAAVLAATTRRVTGNRVAILSQSGGAGVECADLCRELGLQVPLLTQHTQDALRQRIPSYGAIQNPVDFTAAVLSRPELLGDCISAAGRDGNVDMIILALTSLPDLGILTAVADRLEDLGKPVMLSWLGPQLDPPFLASIAARLRAAGISVYDRLDGAVCGARRIVDLARDAAGAEFVGGDELGRARLVYGYR
jgi:acetate---CoA ligase (ADP-forming)